MLVALPASYGGVGGQRRCHVESRTGKRASAPAGSVQQRAWIPAARSTSAACDASYMNMYKVVTCEFREVCAAPKARHQILIFPGRCPQYAAPSRASRPSPRSTSLRSPSFRAMRIGAVAPPRRASLMRPRAKSASSTCAFPGWRRQRSDCSPGARSSTRSQPRPSRRWRARSHPSTVVSDAPNARRRLCRRADACCGGRLQCDMGVGRRQLRREARRRPARPEGDLHARLGG